MTVKQFNRRLSAGLVHRLAVEAAEAQVSLDALTEAVLTEWLRAKEKAERLDWYRKRELPVKVTGRETPQEAARDQQNRQKAVAVLVSAVAVVIAAAWLFKGQQSEWLVAAGGVNIPLGPKGDAVVRWIARHWLEALEVALGVALFGKFGLPVLGRLVESLL